jgi:16S rRNA processing protein RimM
LAIRNERPVRLGLRKPRISAGAAGSAAAPAGISGERVLVGIVRRPHGILGEVKVEAQTDNPDRLVAGAKLFLAPVQGAPRQVVVDSVRPDRDVLLMRFASVRDRNEVETWRGARLEVDLADVPALPEGEVYTYQLIGCLCHDRLLGELGPVEDVLEDGGGQWLKVRCQGGLLLVPMVAAFWVGTDIAARRLELDLPDGYLEAFLQSDDAP